jgi:ATP-binding cassette subfamily B protein
MLNEKEIALLLSKFTIQKAHKGETIFTEGQQAQNLIIITHGELNLVAQESNISMGKVTAGRSVNLYAVIRGMAYQYSGQAQQNLEYLSIPWKAFQKALQRVPLLETYLEKITKYPIIRFLSKEIMDLGCSDEFRIGLLGSMVRSKVKTNSWVFQQGQVPRFAFLLVNGNMHIYRKSEHANDAQSAPAQVPSRTWVAWTESASNQPVSYSFRAASGCEIMGIKASQLKAVIQKHPQDYDTYNQWVQKATSAQKINVETSSDREAVELTQTFLAPPQQRKKMKKSFPWVEQENEMDCGPACLAMISKFYGNDIPVQHWRNITHTNREGTSLFDLANGAEDMGFKTTGLFVEKLEELETSMLPVIAVRQYHFLVIYKFTKKDVTIGDPEVGIRTISKEEFYKGFENAILLIRPTPEFYNVEIPKAGFGHYKDLFIGYNREIALILTCSIILVLFSLFPPILMQIVLDEVITKKDTSLLWFLLGTLGVVTVLQAGMDWVRAYYINYVTIKFDFRALSSFLRKMFSLPYKFFAIRHVGDFTRRLSEMERLRSFLTGEMLETVLNLFTLLIYSVVLFIYSPLIAVVTLLVSPVLVFISMSFSKRLRSAYMQAFSSRAEQESLMTDLINGVPVIKALTAEVPARWRLEEKIVDTLKAHYRFSMTSATLEAYTTVYGTFARMGLMGLAAYLGIKGNLSPGQVLSISVFVNFVIAPFIGLANTWSSIQELISAMIRLNDIFLSPSEKKSGKGRLVKKRLRGEIEFKDVWFRYGGEASDWVLKGVSFVIEPGQKVAIAGPSGSGKSTVANLLLRMFDPLKGQIFIDGRDYREYDLKWLRSQIGLILQHSHLFNGTIAENIAFGDPKADYDKIEQSAIMANAHHFIESKSAGYDYVLSHGGFGLSGGEKQRISCARAFYLDPPVLILDEATSALDGVAEKGLINGVLEASKDRAILSIAHRYTTARFFDHVLLMNQGKIVGFGSHAQLRRESELYSSLFGLDGQEEGMDETQ